MKRLFFKVCPVFFILWLLVFCKTKNNHLSPANIDSLNLKKGSVVLCGPSDKQFGSVSFDISCPGKVRTDFNLAVSLLHSFEYDEAEKVFAKIIEEEPDCAMAYWGVAMCNYHPLWVPPTPSELKKGANAIALARSLQPAGLESDYIEAIGAYYQDADKLDHRTRSVNFRNAMSLIYRKYPKDKETAIFYALSLVAAVDPTDKTFADQRKAGIILNNIYPGEPNHPGIVHYIIHTYDYPELAELALPAARKYASIAPASAHAQHMPSHIFIRLGLWDESIQSNLVSTSAAKCYAQNAAIKGHWDEELHGMDYLVYAYLQKGDSDSAKVQWDYLKTIHEVYPVSFKTAYAFAAIPARCLLEEKKWKQAADLEIHPEQFPWEKFPWQHAITHFARLLGLVHTGQLDSARVELNKLKSIYDTLVREKNLYEANQVQIQLKISEAWILFKEGKNKKALDLMQAAADMEDATEKHPVTPGEVLPARELLGDMLMETGAYAKALLAYQMDLERHANRFNGLYGAGVAAEKTGDKEKAKFYFQQLTNQCLSHSSRPELSYARVYLSKT